MVENERMTYRSLGNSGLRVSSLSYGNYLLDGQENSFACYSAALNNGVNFLDTAEAYDFGGAETILGNTLKRGEWPRDELVVTTKFMWGRLSRTAVGLGRKRLIQGVRNSLKRLQLDYIDVLFLHRVDMECPIEETVRTVGHLIEQGKADYWGTSEYNSKQITDIFRLCDKHGYPYPIVEQAEYNMLARNRLECELVPLISQYGLGTCVWGPLLGGVLTGKYNAGDYPEGSRMVNPSILPAVLDYYKTYFNPEEKKQQTLKTLNALGTLATELGCTQAQLALAWVLKSSDVSTAIMGGSRPEQIEENLKCLELQDKLTPAVLERIEGILGNRPDPGIDWRTWQPLPSRR